MKMLIKPFAVACCAALLLFSCKNDATSPAHANTAGEENLRALITAIHTYPDSMALYQTLIDSLANRGRFAEAAAWCDTALQAEKKYPAGWWLARGDLFRMAGAYDSAATAYRQYLGSNPNDEQVWLNLANTLAEKGDSATLPLCESIVTRFSLPPTRAATAFIAGIYHGTAGRHTEAIAWLDSALRIRYNFPEAWMERGYNLYDKGDYNGAKENFMRLTDLQKGHAEAWYWAGKCAEALQRKSEARTYYEQALRLDASISEAAIGLERLGK